MTEQEPPQTQQNQKRTALHPIYGTVPALIGVVIVIAHLRGALVPFEQQPILMNACLALVVFSLAMWMHYGMERVVAAVVLHFNKRRDEEEQAAARRHEEAEAAAAERHAEAEAAATARHEKAEAAAAKRHAESMEAINRLQRKAAQICTRMKAIEQRQAAIDKQIGTAVGDGKQLDRIEQQGVALGRMFIEEGLPSGTWTSPN